MALPLKISPLFCLDNSFLTRGVVVIHLKNIWIRSHGVAHDLFVCSKFCASGSTVLHVAHESHCLRMAHYVLWNFLLSACLWWMGGDSRIRVWVRLHTFSHSLTPILINRHLQEGGCALAVCQGRAIYPADDFEEKRKRRRRRRARRRARLLWGMLWVHVQLHVSTWAGAWWTAEAQMYSTERAKGTGTCSGVGSIIFLACDTWKIKKLGLQVRQLV